MFIYSILLNTVNNARNSYTIAVHTVFTTAISCRFLSKLTFCISAYKQAIFSFFFNASYFFKAAKVSIDSSRKTAD